MKQKNGTQTGKKNTSRLPTNEEKERLLKQLALLTVELPDNPSNPKEEELLDKFFLIHGNSGEPTWKKEKRWESYRSSIHQFAEEATRIYKGDAVWNVIKGRLNQLSDLLGSIA